MAAYDDEKKGCVSSTKNKTFLKGTHGEEKG